MEPERFDALAKLVASHPSRRALLWRLAGGLLGGATAASLAPSVAAPCAPGCVFCEHYENNCLCCAPGFRACCPKVGPGGCAPGGQCCNDGDCTSNFVCEGGTCTCPLGKTDCHGICTDTSYDPANCGRCDAVCRSPGPINFVMCCDGACVDCPVGADCFYQSCRCPPDQPTVCFGFCVDLQTSVYNCGGCGHLCNEDTQTCQGGGCVCRSDLGFTACAGHCVLLDVDPANCGACGHHCPPTQACAGGICQRRPPCRGRCGPTCACPEGSLCNTRLQPPRCTPPS